MNFNVISSSGSNLIPYSGVPLITSEVRGYNPSQLLSFIDLTNTVIENDPQYNIYQMLTPISGSYPSEYILPAQFCGYGSGYLLVTDRYTVSQYVDYNIPLYHQYQLMYDYYLMDASLIGGFLTIRKNMDSMVATDQYVIENRLYATSSGRYNISTASGFLWTNQPISSNVITARILLPLREYNNFYTVEYNKYINGATTQYYDELIDEQVLYNYGTDYTITPSSVILTASSNIGSGALLFVQKDLGSYITIKPPTSKDDSTMKQPWNMQISCGEFVQSSGLVGGTSLYKIQNNYTSNGLASKTIFNEVPRFINKNVIQLAVSPLYNSNSGYPNYIISGTIISGYVNGINLMDNITSIDYTHGYIYLDTDLKPTDTLSITYTYDDCKTFIASSLNLNPVSGLTSKIDIALNPIGIVITPSGTKFYSSTGSLISNWSHVAYYNLNDNLAGDFDTTPVSGYALESLTEINSSGVISGVITTGSRLLGFYSLNSLSSNMVKIYDARRIGGYDTSSIQSNVSGWRGFADMGFWDGEAFPAAGTVLIQIPSGVYNNIHNIFNVNTVYNVQTAPYTIDLDKIIDKNTTMYDSKATQVTNATNQYIRDVIERYLPVGVLYIIVDENFNVWPSIESES